MPDRGQVLREFYLGRPDGAASIFDIWEDGGARGDSVTPSTFSEPYRMWMGDLLRKLLDERPQPALLSVGCGNGAIEASLVQSAYDVLAVDLLDKPVEMARAKGVKAVCADVATWTPPHTSWAVIYADGLAGHLYDPDVGLVPILSRFRSWLPTGATLVLSNDGPKNSEDVQAHATVDGFYWLSGAYLCRQAEAADFGDVWSTLFTYDRPSGPRERVVLTARA